MPSAHVIKLTCSRCDLSTIVYAGPVHASYLLPDGSRAPIELEYAWCNDCVRVVEVESVPDLADLERRLEGVLAAGGQEGHVADLQARIAWRRLRSHPPRCLRCGGCRWAPLLERSAGGPAIARHPGCGGELIDGVGASITVEGGQSYGVDGFRLERDE
jgi:hypothetical protein